MNIGNSSKITKFVFTFVVLAFLVLVMTNVTKLPASTSATLPAFPGAEGAGSHTIHGRGGAVLEVTNLQDAGQGSLRAAVESKGARIIVFRVGGNIVLQSPLVIANPYLMIAGQTAPGDGVVLSGSQVVVATHDVVIRYLRVRSDGYISDQKKEIDGISIWPNWPWDPYLGDEAYNIIIDHSSISWASDENICTSGRVRDVTIQWNIISEGVNRQGRFGKGLLISDGSKNISIHHNLFAHNDQRNPLTTGDTSADVVNNVIYNWGHSASVSQGGSGKYSNLPSNANFVGNYYKRGVDLASLEIWLNKNLTAKSQFYVRGNIGPRRLTDDVDNWSITGGTWNTPAPVIYKSQKPIRFPPITTSSAEDAYLVVLANSGATLPDRDLVDQRIVKDVRNGTGKLIQKNIDEVGGFPSYQSGVPEVDKDHDGMPDHWEVKYRFNPTNPADRNGDADQDGYTNVEEYLNGTDPRA